MARAKIGAAALPPYGERRKLVALLASGNRLYLDTWRAFDLSPHRYMLANGFSHGAMLDRQSAARVLKGAKMRRAIRVSEGEGPEYRPDPIDAEHTEAIGPRRWRIVNTWNGGEGGRVVVFESTESESAGQFECMKWIHEHTPFSFDEAVTHQGYVLERIQ